MANLYQLTSEYADLLEIAEAGADDDQELLDILHYIDELELSIEDKVSNCIGVIKTFENQINGLDSEIERLKARKSTAQKNLDTFKKWCVDSLDKAQIKKVQTDRGTLTVKNNPTKVQILDASKIPHQYITETIVQNPNKSLIKESLKEGKEVPGCALISSKGLMIR